MILILSQEIIRAKLLKKGCPGEKSGGAKLTRNNHIKHCSTSVDLFVGVKPI